MTRIRNGYQTEKASVTMPGSKVKAAIAKVLEDEGYITGFSAIEKEGKPVLEVGLKYFQGKAVIEEISRVSRPGCRIYCNVNEMPSVIGGILSTAQPPDVSDSIKPFLNSKSGARCVPARGCPKFIGIDNTLARDV